MSGPRQAGAPAARALQAAAWKAWLAAALLAAGSTTLLAALPAAAQSAAAQPAAAPRAVTVAQGLEHPWGLAFLPDGRMLVTERPGRLRIVAPDGRIGAPLAGVPAVADIGQGGLLDVAIDPDFAREPHVYLSYSEPAGRESSTAVARARLVGEPGRERLVELRVIFRQQPRASGGAHFGSRLTFAPDGRLFVTLGDRFSRKDDAQSLANHIGKIVRIERDGRVPPDNPFAGRAGAAAETWSYGHRNVQGAAIHPATGALWAVEHGPQGGDELNAVQRGRNHGWPVVTHGRNYGSGTAIGEGSERADVVAPLRVWLPTSIAPSGMAFLTSDRYPGWQGSLFVGALRGQHLLRLSLDGTRVTGEHKLLGELRARIRDVRQGPDGWLYLLTDESEGRLLRLQP